MGILESILYGKTLTYDEKVTGVFNYYRGKESLAISDEDILLSARQLVTDTHKPGINGAYTRMPIIRQYASMDMSENASTASSTLTKGDKLQILKFARKLFGKDLSYCANSKDGAMKVRCDCYTHMGINPYTLEKMTKCKESHVGLYGILISLRQRRKVLKGFTGVQLHFLSLILPYHENGTFLNVEGMIDGGLL